MRLFIVSRGYPTKEYPMNGIFEMDQAIALSQEGLEVHFLVVDIRSLRRPRKMGFEVIVNKQIMVHAINVPIGKLPVLLETFILRFLFNLLYKKVTKVVGNPDVLHAHFPKMANAVNALKNNRDFPIIVTEHSSGFISQNIPKALIKKAKSGYKNLDRLIAVSPYLKQLIEEMFRVNTTFVPNIVDTTLFNYKEKVLEREFTFITIGSFITRKRMDLTLMAFQRFNKKFAKSKLVMIGDGPEMGSILDFVKHNDLSEQVVITGSLNREKIVHFMRRSSVFVLPSRAETFGVVYIEAMSSGLPVIATRCKGPEAFVNDENGILIDVDSLDQLLSAMIYMYQNITRYSPKTISEYAKKHFSTNVVANQLIKIYTEEIQKKKDYNHDY